MKHNVRAGNRSRHGGVIANVGLVKIDPRANFIQVFGVACKEVVDYAHFHTVLGQELPNQRGPDESGTSGDDASFHTAVRSTSCSMNRNESAAIFSGPGVK